MAAIRHLNQAPVIEAILGFQVDASKAWDAEVVREGLARFFPDFPQIQEQRLFESQFSLVPGKDPESSTKVHPIGAFILRREDGSAAVQLRRDGFAFSQLRPYPDWDVFIEAAMVQWKVFSEWIGIGAPFNVFIRFINRVSYPCDGFKLEKYFENPPKSPPGTSWAFRFFREHYVYTPEGGRFSVNSVFSPVVEVGPQKPFDFLLDLTISPSQSLAESGDSIESLLPELRRLKNEAFFSKFTETGLEPYH